MMAMKNSPIIQVRNLTLSYDDNLIMKDVSFDVSTNDIFVIMGTSGGGKSTLLKCLIGLKKPNTGTVMINGVDFWALDEKSRNKILGDVGILYQSSALFSSMTLAENIAMPMELYTDFTADEIRKRVAFKLSLVGLGGYEEFYPNEISGGMKKRAGLARALALDPKILFFDEPSAGLDPIRSKKLDDLILQIGKTMGTTIVMVTHELDSIFAIANNSIFLDSTTKTVTGYGNPHDLLRAPPNAEIREFLTRGKTKQGK